MKVILKESITGLGSPVYEAEKTKLAELENKKITEAKEIESKLSGFNLEIKVAVTDEEAMYGSIGTKEISESLNEKGFAIDRQSIRLPEGVLKELGEFDLDIELHPEVVSKIKIVLKPE